MSRKDRKREEGKDDYTWLSTNEDKIQDVLGLPLASLRACLKAVAALEANWEAGTREIRALVEAHKDSPCYLVDLLYARALLFQLPDLKDQKKCPRAVYEGRRECLLPDAKGGGPAAVTAVLAQSLARRQTPEAAALLLSAHITYAFTFCAARESNSLPYPVKTVDLKWHDALRGVCDAAVAVVQCHVARRSDAGAFMRTAEPSLTLRGLLKNSKVTYTSVDVSSLGMPGVSTVDRSNLTNLLERQGTINASRLKMLEAMALRTLILLKALEMRCEVPPGLSAGLQGVMERLWRWPPGAGSVGKEEGKTLPPFEVFSAWLTIELDEVCVDSILEGLHPRVGEVYRNCKESSQKWVELLRHHLRFEQRTLTAPGPKEEAAVEGGDDAGGSKADADASNAEVWAALQDSNTGAGIYYTPLDPLPPGSLDGLNQGVVSWEEELDVLEQARKAEARKAKQQQGAGAGPGPSASDRGGRKGKGKDAAPSASSSAPPSGSPAAVPPGQAKDPPAPTVPGPGPYLPPARPTPVGHALASLDPTAAADLEQQYRPRIDQVGRLRDMWRSLSDSERREVLEVSVADLEREVAERTRDEAAARERASGSAAARAAAAAGATRRRSSAAQPQAGTDDPVLQELRRSLGAGVLPSRDQFTCPLCGPEGHTVEHSRPSDAPASSSPSPGGTGNLLPFIDHVVDAHTTEVLALAKPLLVDKDKYRKTVHPHLLNRLREWLAIQPEPTWTAGGAERSGASFFINAVVSASQRKVVTWEDLLEFLSTGMEPSIVSLFFYQTCQCCGDRLAGSFFLNGSCEAQVDTSLNIFPGQALWALCPRCYHGLSSGVGLPKKEHEHTKFNPSDQWRFQMMDRRPTCDSWFSLTLDSIDEELKAAVQSRQPADAMEGPELPPTGARTTAQAEEASGPGTAPPWGPPRAEGPTGEAPWHSMPGVSAPSTPPETPPPSPPPPAPPPPDGEDGSGSLCTPSSGGSTEEDYYEAGDGLGAGSVHESDAGAGGGGFSVPMPRQVPLWNVSMTPLGDRTPSGQWSGAESGTPDTVGYVQDASYGGVYTSYDARWHQGDLEEGDYTPSERAALGGDYGYSDSDGGSWGGQQDAEGGAGPGPSEGFGYSSTSAWPASESDRLRWGPGSGSAGASRFGQHESGAPRDASSDLEDGHGDLDDLTRLGQTLPRLRTLAEHVEARGNKSLVLLGRLSDALDVPTDGPESVNTTERSQVVVGLLKALQECMAPLLAETCETLISEFPRVIEVLVALRLNSSYDSLYESVHRDVQALLGRVSASLSRLAHSGIISEVILSKDAFLCIVGAVEAEARSDALESVYSLAETHAWASFVLDGLDKIVLHAFECLKRHALRSLAIYFSEAASQALEAYSQLADRTRRLYSRLLRLDSVQIVRGPSLPDLRLGLNSWKGDTWEAELRCAERVRDARSVTRAALGKAAGDALGFGPYSYTPLALDGSRGLVAPSEDLMRMTDASRGDLGVGPDNDALLRWVVGVEEGTTEALQAAIRAAASRMRSKLPGAASLALQLLSKSSLQCSEGLSDVFEQGGSVARSLGVLAGANDVLKWAKRWLLPDAAAQLEASKGHEHFLLRADFRSPEDWVPLLIRPVADWLEAGQTNHVDEALQRIDIDGPRGARAAGIELGFLVANVVDAACKKCVKVAKALLGAAISGVVGQGLEVSYAKRIAMEDWEEKVRRLSGNQDAGAGSAADSAASLSQALAGSRRADATDIARALKDARTARLTDLEGRRKWLQQLYDAVQKQKVIQEGGMDSLFASLDDNSVENEELERISKLIGNICERQPSTTESTTIMESLLEALFELATRESARLLLLSRRAPAWEATLAAYRAIVTGRLDERAEMAAKTKADEARAALLREEEERQAKAAAEKKDKEAKLQREREEKRQREKEKEDEDERKKAAARAAPVLSMSDSDEEGERTVVAAAKPAAPPAAGPRLVSLDTSESESDEDLEEKSLRRLREQEAEAKRALQLAVARRAAVAPATSEAASSSASSASKKASKKGKKETADVGDLWASPSAETASAEPEVFSLAFQPTLHKRDPGVVFISSDGLWQCPCGTIHRATRADACSACKVRNAPCMRYFRGIFSDSRLAPCDDPRCRYVHARIELQPLVAEAANAVMGPRVARVAVKTLQPKLEELLRAAKAAKGGKGKGAKGPNRVVTAVISGAALVSPQAASTASVVTLRNEEGEYNCFLNVLVQSLWHVRPFREALLALGPVGPQPSVGPGPSDVPEAGVLVALRQIFASLEVRASATATSGAALLAPTDLRDALSARFGEAGLFQEGQMNDAAEALMSILDCLDRAEGERPDSWVRRLFGLRLCHSMSCKTCYRKSLDASWCQLTELVQAYVSRQYTLVGAIRRDREEDRRSCDTDVGGCGAFNELVYTLTQPLPKLYTVLLSWDTGSATSEEVEATLRGISTAVSIKQLYRVVGGSSLTEPQITFQLKAVVCYYGSHYMAFALDGGKGGGPLAPSAPVWTYFDDKVARPTGQWEDVVAHCKKGKLQPVVLIYERTD